MPIMAIFYIVGAIVVLILNAGEIPAAFASIFHDALYRHRRHRRLPGRYRDVRLPHRYGPGRVHPRGRHGLRPPLPTPPPPTTTPARQGLWGSFEVFFDSIVMCTITGLVILTSRLWHRRSHDERGRHELRRL